MRTRKGGLRTLLIIGGSLLVNGAILALLFRVPTAEVPPAPSPIPKAPELAKPTGHGDTGKVIENRAAEPDGRRAEKKGSATQDRDRPEDPDTSSRQGLPVVLEEAPEPMTPAAESPQPLARTEPPPHEPEHDPIRAEARAEYAARKAKTSSDARSQTELAFWCDNQGLWDEAKAHWAAVLQAAPADPAARKRLGHRASGELGAPDERLAREAEDKEAAEFWGKTVAALHRQMHTKGRSAAARRDEAINRLDSIRDPRAVPAIWDNLGADANHHPLVIRLLGRLDSPRSSQMLAALAIYSADPKARSGANAALSGRDAAPYRRPLVALISAPLRYHVARPPGRRDRVLIIEGETKIQQFLYPVEIPPPAFACTNVRFQRPLTAAERNAARDANANQAKIAQKMADLQVESDKQAVEAINQAINGLNERVAGLLNTHCGEALPPTPEAWRSWLARVEGTTYQPPDPTRKVVIASVVAPIYRPTFLPVPVAS